MEDILYIILFFLFLSGLLTVSEGAYIPIKIKIGINNIYFIIIGIVKCTQKSGKIIKNNVEDIKQSILLFACTPKEVNRIPLNINNNKIVSLTIPRIIDISNIKIIFVIV